MAFRAQPALMLMALINDLEYLRIKRDLQCGGDHRFNSHSRGIQWPVNSFNHYTIANNKIEQQGNILAGDSSVIGAYPPARGLYFLRLEKAQRSGSKLFLALDQADWVGQCSGVIAWRDSHGRP